MGKCKVCGLGPNETYFYKGNVSYCKTHWKERVKNNRDANSAYYKEFDKNRSKLAHRVEARIEYQKTDAFSSSHRKATNKYRVNHEIRRAAQVSVGNAVRDGRLKKEPCFICGCGDTEAHHADYSVPLHVIWLCVAHHKEVHQEARQMKDAA